MITVISTLSHSSHHYSLISPNHGRPSRSIPTLPFATAARAPIGSSPTHRSYFRCCTRSHGHHVTVAQPHVMQATSSADMGFGGSNPHFMLFWFHIHY